MKTSFSGRSIFHKCIFATAAAICFFSVSAQAACPVNQLKNLNYQLLLTSETGTLKRINIPKKLIHVDHEFDQLSFSYDVRPILKTKAFKKGIAKFAISSQKALTTRKNIETTISIDQFINRNAKVPKNPDPYLAPNSFVLFTIDDDGYALNELDYFTFSKGDRVKAPYRPLRKFRKSMDRVSFEMYCDDGSFK